jgi:peptidoglycan/xylan/chitin deacetylase (PgdA/CDA1 family)
VFLRNSCILTYHGVSRPGGFGTLRLKAFERQMRLLSRTADFVDLQCLKGQVIGSRPRVLLTFDDGFRNNFAHVVPILRRLRIPAVFFVCDRHSHPGKYLWFSYLRALEGFFAEPALKWRSQTHQMRPETRRASVEDIRTRLLSLEPHPSALYEAMDKELPRLEDFVEPDSSSELFAGLTSAELREIAADPLFSIGIHTSDHAFLTRCVPAEMRAQIARNVQFINSITAAQPPAIAFPAGDYDDRVLEVCRDLKIPLGFAVIPRSNGGGDLEFGRIGIYSESLIALMVKVYLGNAMRASGIQFG